MVETARLFLTMITLRRPPFGGSHPLEQKKGSPEGEPFCYMSQEGFEPPTDALEGRCSIQLSY